MKGNRIYKFKWAYCSLIMDIRAWRCSSGKSWQEVLARRGEEGGFRSLDGGNWLQTLKYLQSKLP